MCSLGNDPCTLCCRVVCILDVERDAVSENRVDSFFVKDCESSVRKLSHLVVCDLRDREGVLNEVGVNSENVVNVCPVLVNVSTYGCCEDGTCNIGTASGECDDLAALGIAVETGEDKDLVCLYTFCDVEYNGERLILSRTGYTGEDGFELYTTPENIVEIWDRLLKAGVEPCGLGCRDTLRFEAGLPLYGDELSPEISPVMAGLSMFCKFEKDFIGKEALLDQKAGNLSRKLVGIEIEDNAIPRAGYPVELEDGTEVGVVTTGYHSISLDKSICFALVDKAYAALDTPLCIHIRKRVFPGKVVKKRFYQTNYKK